MKLINLFILIMIVNTVSVFSQPNKSPDLKKPSSKSSFEGVIDFVWEKYQDTTTYSYVVKNRKVRLEIHDNCNCKKVDSWLVFDLDAKTIIAFEPSRKIYKNITPKQYLKESSEDFKITAGDNVRNTKYINGYKCYQWRVKNTKENSEVAFWVAYDNFDFFTDFLKLWNRREKHARYFLQIPNTMGYFPMLSVERTMLREEKQRLKVLKITKKPIDDSLFAIPEDFTNYDN